MENNVKRTSVLANTKLYYHCLIKDNDLKAVLTSQLTTSEMGLVVWIDELVLGTDAVNSWPTGVSGIPFSHTLRWLHSSLLERESLKS